jgi:hypothetical protein
MEPRCIEIAIVMGAVPSGDYQRAKKVRDEGHLEEALRLTYQAATVGLVGIFRGRTHHELFLAERGEADWTIEEVAELEGFLLDVRNFQDQAMVDSRVAYKEALDYYLTGGLDLSFRIVVPARALIRQVEELLEEVQDLPYDDLHKDLTTLRNQIEGMVREPSSAIPESLDLLHDQLFELRDLAGRVRFALQKAVKDEEVIKSRRTANRNEQKQRRRERENWREKLGLVEESAAVA